MFPSFLSFVLSKWPGACWGSAPSRPGPAGPSRNGGELSSAAPGRQCQRPRSAQGGRPIVWGQATRSAVPAPLRRACGATRSPPAPPGRFLVGSDSRGPAEPGARALPADRDTPLRTEPGARPAHGSGASARGARAGDADDPERSRRACPGAPRLTGIGRAAGHYSIASSAPAPRRRRRRRARAPSARRSRLSERNAGRGRELRAGRGGGRRPACPSAECPPAAAAAEARRGAGGERGAGRGGRPCAEGRRPQRRARLGRSRSAAEGAGFRKSKHFDRKSES